MTYEYRVEVARFAQGEERNAALLALANRLGNDGWRVCRLDLAPRLALNERELHVLFERAKG